MPRKPSITVVLLTVAVLLAGCERAQQISSADQYAYEISVANFKDRFGIAWHGGDQEHSGIYLRYTDVSGRPMGTSLRLTSGEREAYEPDLQVIHSDPLLAWYEKESHDGSLTALLARFDRHGRLRWQRELSSASCGGRNAVARVSGNEIAVAWIETCAEKQPAVLSARFNADGNPTMPARQEALADRDTWNLNAAMDDAGTFYVVYDARAGARAKELQLLKIERTRTAHFTLTSDDGYASSYPDLSIDVNQAALTWFDARNGNSEIYLFATAFDRLVGPIDTQATRVTHTPGASIGAYLAWNDSRIGLAWCDTVGDQYEIYAQSFDKHGKPLQSVARLTHNDTQSSIPAIRPAGKGFAIAWNEYASVQTTAEHDLINSSVAMLRLWP